ncbi:5-formyltetrahydrofolate cyclo-ligase [Cytobacillus oceanisediminis]|uniref:5-formyltetrahydrofolate cyclo-ligase n=1 Tax=Cytobacillus oceanisediminis TaxID=665099 RepID=UPI0023DC8A92|nr:5-formyltetrahydrofolate cyclo-ligase [Cytobacillus oceanisediminis]MDF2038615.1 5-formyltetrahydrofolate cyclo-ligase [Cytobacillus oceanisediminis]
MEMDKKALRKKMLERMKELSKPEYEQLSYEIACSLYSSPLWLQAKTIGITVSKPPEADTWQIIRKAWEEGKRVAVPKCIPRSKQMVFRELNSFRDLESVYYGLWEPSPEKTDEVRSEEIETLIVPGLAYMKNGFRLGFGGGYYDRFLEHYEGRTVSLAFELQLINGVPVENHDKPVEMIITDQRVWASGDA